jgi:hypothetical protein
MDDVQRDVRGIDEVILGALIELPRRQRRVIAQRILGRRAM